MQAGLGGTVGLDPLAASSFFHPGGLPPWKPLGDLPVPGPPGPTGIPARRATSSWHTGRGHHSAAWGPSLMTREVPVRELVASTFMIW